MNYSLTCEEGSEAVLATFYSPNSSLHFLTILLILLSSHCPASPAIGPPWFSPGNWVSILKFHSTTVPSSYRSHAVHAPAPTCKSLPVPPSVPFSTWQTHLPNPLKCYFLLSCPGCPNAEWISLSFGLPRHSIHPSSVVLITLQCNYCGQETHLIYLWYSRVLYSIWHIKNIRETFAKEEILKPVDWR